MFKVRVNGIDKAIAELDTTKARMDAKLDEFMRRLAEIGLATASVGYSAFAWTEFKNGNPIEKKADISVTVEPIGNGYAVVAEGVEVMFVEFGAGVYYNGSESYPGERPEGVVGIGEYGKGHGKQDAWGYKDGDGVTIARGNMPSAAMYYAKEDIRRDIERIAREVFR